MQEWFLPITLIPSIAVLVTSTARMTLGLTDEINRRVEFKLSEDTVELKVKQIKRLSIAAILMYVSLAVLIMSTLLTGMLMITKDMQNISILISIVIFLFAIVGLIIFSYNAYFIRQKQFKQ